MIPIKLHKQTLFKSKFSLAVLLAFVFLLFSNSLIAQDSLKMLAHQKTDSALLADTNVLTNSDYLSALEKVLETQNRVPAILGGFSSLNDIEDGLDDDDSAISLIKERLSVANDRTLNIQNLQMYDKLLDELQDNIKEDYDKSLASYATQLDQLKRDLLILRKDTVLHHVYINAGLRSMFAPQLLEINYKWKVTDSLINANAKRIKALKNAASANSFAIAELIFKNAGLLDKATVNALGKERRYIWEPINWAKANQNRIGFQSKIAAEKRIANYYFENTSNNRIIPLVIGFIFFIWVFYNFSSLKRLHKLDSLNKFRFKFVSPVPILGALIFVLSLAPLFDLDAPIIYFEVLQFLTLFTLTIFFATRLPRGVFFMWCGYFILFLALPILRLLGLPIYEERWAMISINSVAIIYGSALIAVLWKRGHHVKLVRVAGIIYVVLNILALVCNVFGRVTLSQTFNTTAVYSFAHAISYTILVDLTVEAFLLQIQSSRLRKKYPEHFAFIPIEKGIYKITGIVALVLWFIIFGDNVNILDTIYDNLSSIFSESHTLGSFSFTLGGVFLFLGIIMVANFLQKYIAYFFGDLGEDMQVENKEGRSRLLMTRLIVLIGGFLLAVAASGLPIDRITIILGALSVGIGLGLQNIVNNFVSGIILIFDRTLHIGDVVEISDKKGRVREIGIRTSKLLTDDGAEIIIPNGDVVSHNIINWTLTNTQVRMNMSFVIAKPFNIDDAIAICRRECLANPNVVDEKEPDIIITAVTAASTTIKMYFWCKSITLTEATYSILYPTLYGSLEAEGVKLL